MNHGLPLYTPSTEIAKNLFRFRDSCWRMQEQYDNIINTSQASLFSLKRSKSAKFFRIGDSLHI
jgi:hypothetical protein